MSTNWSIGLTGLQTAQRGLELVGMNIANASTEGYHRQEMVLAPIDSLGGRIAVGSGVEILDLRRNMDVLLESEFTRQQPLLGQIYQELETLESMESSMGELDYENLTKALNSYFSSLAELSAEPTSRPHLEQVVWAAESFAAHVRNLSEFTTELQRNVYEQAEQMMSELNNKLNRISELNQLINITAAHEGNVNVVQDQRDQLINEVAELMPARISRRDLETGTVTLEGWGMPLVLQSHASELKVELVAENTLGVGPSDAVVLMTDAEGGRMGGLLALYNEIIPGLRDKLDTLSGELITRINRLHVQGVGSNGAFQDLTGWAVPTDKFEDWENADVTAGTIYLRTIAPDGTTTANRIVIDPTDTNPGEAGTAVELAAAIDALPNMNSWVSDRMLHIQADILGGYKFDFVPEAFIEYPGAWNGSSPALSGTYEGEENDLLTCEVLGSAPGADDRIGATDGLRLQVRDGAMQVIADINLGPGYAAGDPVEIVDGLKVAFDDGTLRVGETFTIQALAYADTSDVLASCGINTFFEGNDAETISVCDRVLEDVGNFASASGVDGLDNLNTSRMYKLSTQRLTGLSNERPEDYVRQIYTSIGQEIAGRETRRQGLESVEKQLMNQRDAVGGVDINEEATQLILFEQMFQATARFISVQDEAMRSLMELI